MGTELVRACIKQENMEISSIPPGFESIAPFTLKKVEDKEVKLSNSTFSSSDSRSEIEGHCSDDSRTEKSLRPRPSINYSSLENSSDDDSDSKQALPLRQRLPKGVIRGCNDCANCQKVTAKWRPEEACRPDLEEVPIFHPTEEEFENPITYIASIRSKAEAYGICRIVPPPSWRPPCPLKQKLIWEGSKFATRIQRIDKLQNRDSMRQVPDANHQKRRKKRRCMKAGDVNSSGDTQFADVVINEAERFGFEPGPDFTMQEFQGYAADFKSQYFMKHNSTSDPGVGVNMTQGHREPSVQDIEGEYWRVVQRPTEEIEVLYGADLETGVFGSGFPKNSDQVVSDSDAKYATSGWNLNNFPRLPGSVLSYESSDISGVLVPWLYIGMCFSSFCWHVEDHHLYSLNYMHWGDSKMWYGVPASDALKLEASMRKHLPDLFEEQPDLLHKLVTQLSPSILRAEGVPVYRCVQNAGEFVLTFPRAYHAGFNCGFNCAEAVNVAPVDWLPHGQNAIELYCEQGRKTSVSHDKLLLGAARNAVKAQWELSLLKKNTLDNLRWPDVCGKDGILYKAFKSRVDMEKVRRDFMCNSSQALKMDSNFDTTSERECSVCLFDLHLSAAGCHYCSPDKYACLNHAKQLCSCSWGAKFFLFRYDLNELNLLVEALEGKLSAIYRWARMDLGLALASYIHKENSQAPKLSGKLSCSSEVAGIQGINVQPVNALNYQNNEGIAENSNPSKTNSDTPLVQRHMAPEESLTSEKMKVCSKLGSSSRKGESITVSGQCKKDFLPDSGKPIVLGSPSCTTNLTQKPETSKVLFPKNIDVILLSDDEAEESNTKPSRVELSTSTEKIKEEERVIPNGSSARQIVCALPSAPIKSTNSASPVSVKAEGSVNIEAHLRLNQQDHSTGCTLSEDFKKADEGFSIQEESSDCNMQTQPLPVDAGKTNKTGPKRLESGTNLRPAESFPNSLDNPCGSSNNLDQYSRQKGPRIAKVVRRINCNVEPLDFGVVQSRKLWCDAHAIYPKGFRSRVRYISVLDPANTCYYVSEILDVGWDGPLFMVSLEDSPGEVFAHVSAARCWEMIRERVNQKITKQHKLGRPKLPPLQPPGSLDGMEMFGFTSPAIVQGIQTMDQKRVSIEYWKSRPFMQIPQHTNSGNSSVNSWGKSGGCLIDQQACNRHEVENIINGLLKKASLEELNVLHSVLSTNNPTLDRGSVTRLLSEEIDKRSK